MINPILMRIYVQVLKSKAKPHSEKTGMYQYTIHMNNGGRYSEGLAILANDVYLLDKGMTYADYMKGKR